MTDSQELLLKVRGLSKSFEGNIVLDGVDFDLRPGQVHILFGENGAGKSTFTKILCGGLRPDGGEVFVENKKVSIKNAALARSLGIVAVHQDFSLVPQMSVMENLYLGRDLIKGGLLQKKAMLRHAREQLESWELGGEINLHQKVRELSMEQQQIIAIVRAMLQPVKILILDEPTSNFTDRETNTLFAKIAELKQRGIGIIYISHVVEELKAIGDRVTILRDGKAVGKIETNAEITRGNLLKGMIGRRSDRKTFPDLNTNIGEKNLEVRDLSTASGLRGINLTLRQGEILGIGGLPDSGKTLVGRALFGLEDITQGSIALNGEPIHDKLTPTRALRKDIMYFPAEKLDGLVLCRSIKENQTLPSIRRRFSQSGLIQHRLEKKAVADQIAALGIKPKLMDRHTQLLSGGNQQKVIMARGMLNQSKTFIFDEVTRGVDIASKIQFYQLVNELSRTAQGVIYISSEIAELLDLCNRIIILYDKRVVGNLEHHEATREKLVHHILGLEMEA